MHSIKKIYIYIYTPERRQETGDSRYSIRDISKETEGKRQQHKRLSIAALAAAIWVIRGAGAPYEKETVSRDSL